MQSMFHISRLSSVFLGLFLAFPLGLGQQVPSERKDDVIRITTDLVQTDVTVLDKQGRFVEGLQREQFELLVDGKPQSISFFEQVTAGSRREAHLAANRETTRPAIETARTDPSPTRGRTIFFFVDDKHLSPNNMVRTRETLHKFVANIMGAADQVAITSASGQLGFLQQLTNDKTVLGLTIDRLKPRVENIADLTQPPMTEHQALAIERNDPGTLELFIDKTCEEFRKTKGIICRATGMTNGAVLDEVNVRSDRRGGSSGGRGGTGTGGGGSGTGRTIVTSSGPKEAEREVRSRARVLTRQATYVTLGTLTSLESLVRRAGALPERKLLLFVSDGFFINYISATHAYDLRRITDAAIRSGTVIYTFDARGLSSGLNDATQSGLFDTSGRAARTKLGEIRDSQEALRNLADETGGRAWLNSNDLDAGITRAISETSNYYLLAWRPESPEQTKDAFRKLKVTIRDRPDLVVRVGSGYFTDNPEASAGETVNAGTSVDDRLLASLRASYPKRGVPLVVSAGYLNTEKDGWVLAASVQIENDVLISNEEKRANSDLDLMGVVVDDKGTILSSLKQQVTLPPDSMTSSLITALQFPKIPPGLHQVRIAVRDKSGRIGSAMQWIQVPDLSKKKFSMSSLFLSESASGGPGSTSKWIIKPDRVFARTSKLKFQAFAYNADRSGTPRIFLKIELRREGQILVQTPARELPTEGVVDLERIPVTGEFPLEGFPVGRYELTVTLIDENTKSTASQRLDFAIQ